MAIKGNFWHELPRQCPSEITDVLAQSQHVRIERIVSYGQTSPKDFWYDQDEDEWVLVLRGAGCLAFADGRPDCVLQEGDYLWLPAHCRHQVKSTAVGVETVWLAIFGTASPAK